MPRALIIATLAISALTAFGERPTAHAERKPLPVVRRSDKPPTTPFDTPPLIVLGRVYEQRTILADEGLIDGIGEEDPPKLERQYRLSLAVMRVNERLPLDPDLGERYNFLLRQKPGDELTLEFGKNYILFVKFAKPIRGRPWRKSDPDPPPYFIAVPDAGFEIVGKKISSATVRVLRRGGVLAPYDGKPVDDVFRLITGQSFLEFEPK